MKKWILTFDINASIEGHDLGDVEIKVANEITHEQLEDRAVSLANENGEPIEIDQSYPKQRVSFISCSDAMRELLIAESYVKGVNPR